MPSVFAQRNVRRMTTRQVKYFATKKPNSDRKNVKHEQKLQIEICEYIRLIAPGVHFRSDTGSGAFNSEWEKDIHNQQQSAPGLPDLSIFAARHGYHGLEIEIKTDDAKIKRKRDATKIWVRKNKKGKIVERDYKLRKAGDWYDPHVERQAQRLQELRDAGYCAHMIQGLEQAKKLLRWYFGVPEPPQAQELF